MILTGVRGQQLGFGVLVTGSPMAPAAYIMAQQLKSDAELSGAIILLSTPCSLAAYSYVIYLIKILSM